VYVLLLAIILLVAIANFTLRRYVVPKRSDPIDFDSQEEEEENAHKHSHSHVRSSIVSSFLGNLSSSVNSGSRGVLFSVKSNVKEAALTRAPPPGELSIRNLHEELELEDFEDIKASGGIL